MSAVPAAYSATVALHPFVVRPADDDLDVPPVPSLPPRSAVGTPCLLACLGAWGFGWWRTGRQGQDDRAQCKDRAHRMENKRKRGGIAIILEQMRASGENRASMYYSQLGVAARHALALIMNAMLHGATLEVAYF